MSLDPPTLVVVLIGICALVGCATWLTWQSHRDVMALAYWGAAALLAAVGLWLILLKPFLSATLMVPLGNAAVQGSALLVWFGVRVFAERPLPLRVGFSVFLATSVGVAFFLLVRDDVIARVFIGSAGVTVVATMTGVDLLRHSRSLRQNRATRLTALWFLLHAGFLAGRTLLMLDVGPITSVLSPNTLVGISFLEAILAMVGWSFGFLAMTSERLQADLNRLATVDPLTGALTRGAFFKQAERELARQQRTGTPLTLLLLDLDHFKRINDSFGHLAGDALLRSFAALVTERMRRADLFGRYGGEEFCLLLPDTNDMGAVSVAEALRRDFTERVVEFEGNLLAASVSVGVAESRPGDTLDGLFSTADTALYRAKRNGRNQVALGEAAI